jgi:hypothetical protein
MFSATRMCSSQEFFFGVVFPLRKKTRQDNFSKNSTKNLKEKTRTSEPVLSRSHHRLSHKIRHSLSHVTTLSLPSSDLTSHTVAAATSNMERDKSPLNSTVYQFIYGIWRNFNFFKLFRVFYLKNCEGGFRDCGVFPDLPPPTDLWSSASTSDDPTANPRIRKNGLAPGRDQRVMLNQQLVSMGVTVTPLELQA